MRMHKGSCRRRALKGEKNNAVVQNSTVSNYIKLQFLWSLYAERLDGNKGGRQNSGAYEMITRFGQLSSTLQKMRLIFSNQRDVLSYSNCHCSSFFCNKLFLYFFSSPMLIMPTNSTHMYHMYRIDGLGKAIFMNFNNQAHFTCKNKRGLGIIKGW